MKDAERVQNADKVRTEKQVGSSIKQRVEWSELENPHKRGPRSRRDVKQRTMAGRMREEFSQVRGHKKKRESLVRWHLPLISVVGRQRQENL